MSTVQCALAAQGADQCENLDPGSGRAVSTTRPPRWMCAEHDPGQSIPPGLETTVPFPVTATLSATVGVAADELPVAAAATIAARTRARITFLNVVRRLPAVNPLTPC
jgi:hypothetical protein